MFDPNRELLGAGLIWARLPGLPLHLWNEQIFKDIGNLMGPYLDHDRSFIDSKKMAFARILVHLDTREVLEEAINIQCCNSTKAQLLDYEGVPFRCHRCHKVEHVFKDFPLNGSSLAPRTHSRLHPISPVSVSLQRQT